MRKTKIRKTKIRKDKIRKNSTRRTAKKLIARQSCTEARALSGSYTVEASFVMAMVLLSIVTVIRFAYGVHDETLGALILQETLEIARHGEMDLDVTKIQQQGIKKMSQPYSWPEYRLEISRNKRAVFGRATGGRWELEMEIKVFDPEEFMRMWSLLEGFEIK